MRTQPNATSTDAMERRHAPRAGLPTGARAPQRQTTRAASTHPASSGRSWMVPTLVSIVVLYGLFMWKVNTWSATPVAAQYGGRALDGVQDKAAAATKPMASLKESVRPSEMHIHSDQLLQVEHGPSRTTAGSPAPTTLPPSPSSTTPPLTPLTSNPPPSAPAKSEALQELDPVAPTERPQATTAELEEAMEPVAPTVHPMTSSSAPPQRSFESRHDTVAGYDAMIKYLAAYDADHDGSDALYLFFVCSDENHQPYDWNEQCGPARTAVYDVFAKAPESNHLLTIYAGTAEYWQAANDFRSDRDVRVKMLPCLMKWEGHDGETSGMMVGVSLMEPQFLRYLLKSTDEPDPNLSAVALETKQHRVVAGRPAFDELMEQYRRGDMDENDVLPPLYVMFVSGRMEGNKRPWCPYCRYTEVPVDYAFYAFAPLGAHFVRVEVNPSYKAWKQPNEFNRDPALNLRGVPGFYIVKRVANADQQNELVYERLYQRFDMMNELRILFETTTAPQA